ncbi:hypothetical protein AT575_07540 [Streptococcus penaeicida]|uniref:Thiol reductase thioredoxin n=1 Tax=Streptococcus penaeicida TaxID=1765960 RepID=A0A2N8LB17_9STRE|nr:conjugal transfer protein TraF [Streptococcus penaeicida]PND47358.1 hypothetical protein AT575_07540 [Streptococcus penaeicida]
MDFQEAISYFTEITMAQLNEKLETKEDFILFLGRPTCSFCRRFAPKLAQVSQEKELTVYYIPSDSIADFDAIQEFRASHQIQTVPALVVGNAGSVKVVCDSSLSPSEIADFILGGSGK